MSKLKLASALLAAAALIAVSYVMSSNNQRSDETDPQTITFSGDAQLFQADPNRPDVDTAIAFWQKRVADNPRAYIDYTYLGEAYARKARETGDVSDYQRAEAALRQALSVNPKYAQTSALLSGVLFAMHDFRGALAIAEPLADHPRALQALATVGDAHMALGNYEQAEATFRKLLERAPVPSVYSRLAIMADLRGDSEQALSLMHQASQLAQQSGDYGESLAWYEYQVGELYFKAGQVDSAASHYQAALGVFDNYYLALAGLGKVRAAQGDYQAAIDLYRRATAIIPQPELLAALGDVYTATGQPDKAKLQYDTVEYIGKLAKINQQVYNRQLANFDSDHDMRLDEALRLALTELEFRKDVYGYDAAAWAYYKNGMFDQAQEVIQQAMKLGTRDARLYYHAGMIAKAQGRNADAQRLLSEALSINPHFDLLQARLARATLDQLAANSD